MLRILTRSWRFVNITLTCFIHPLYRNPKEETGMVADKSKPKKKKEIHPADPVAEAGRKVFAQQIRRMKRHEAGSRTGEDIESVHQMRVSIRRMRSLFKLIGAHYRAKTVDKYERGLRQIARVLGAIRDLDVLILDLQAYQAALSTEDKVAIAQVIAVLDERRRASRVRLNKRFDSKRYARFLRQFQRFAKRPKKGARPLKRNETPHQLRHVLPLLLHERLARVRAYDTVLPASDDAILHALRVEYKQLRYALEFFQPILGRSARSFLTQVKAMQEILGRIHDIAVFSETISRLDRLTPEQAAALEGYLSSRNDELLALRDQFYQAWTRFNKRAPQRQFSDSLLVLR